MQRRHWACMIDYDRRGANQVVEHILLNAGLLMLKAVVAGYSSVLGGIVVWYQDWNEPISTSFVHLLFMVFRENCWCRHDMILRTLRWSQLQMLKKTILRFDYLSLQHSSWGMLWLRRNVVCDLLHAYSPDPDLDHIISVVHCMSFWL
jgi:hypothetical protein